MQTTFHTFIVLEFIVYKEQEPFFSGQIELLCGAVLMKVYLTGSSTTCCGFCSRVTITDQSNEGDFLFTSP
jgi:hypothetical protein